jgi:hypothetical protein
VANNLHGKTSVNQQVPSTASYDESSGGWEEDGDDDEDNVRAFDWHVVCKHEVVEAGWKGVVTVESLRGFESLGP